MSGATQSAVPAQDETRLRVIALVVYALYLLALTNGVTAIVGVVLATVKRGEARGTVYQSHFSNAIAIFWIALVTGTLIVAGLLSGFFGGFGSAMHPHPAAMVALLPIAAAALLAIFVWCLYRTIKGLIRAADGKAYR